MKCQSSDVDLIPRPAESISVLLPC